MFEVWDDRSNIVGTERPHGQKTKKIATHRIATDSEVKRHNQWTAIRINLCLPDVKDLLLCLGNKLQHLRSTCEIIHGVRTDLCAAEKSVYFSSVLLINARPCSLLMLIYSTMLRSTWGHDRWEQLPHCDCGDHSAAEPWKHNLWFSGFRHWMKTQPLLKWSNKTISTEIVFTHFLKQHSHAHKGGVSYFNNTIITTIGCGSGCREGEQSVD